MGIAAPVIVSEMDDWMAIGGGNSGIVGDARHSYGFHLAANEIGPDDYSRQRDPNGSGGPYVNWSYSCAGDFSHRGDERLRAMHRNVLARLMRGELPMVCEFIGKPWADQPVYYWARWNGIGTLQRYTGQGHDTWSHISWYRSKADQRAYPWVSSPTPTPAPAPRPTPAPTPAPGPGYAFPLPQGYYFGPHDGPYNSISGWYGERYSGRLASEWLQEWANQLARRGWSVGKGRQWLGVYGNDGKYGSEYDALARKFQSNQNLTVDGEIGPQTWWAAYHNPVS